ncbi:probable Nephrocystin-3 [Coccomyxa sp. Obi]|nr:probable Nephrocystin-3 [Coccomyxa sp. Obi]
MSRYHFWGISRGLLRLVDRSTIQCFPHSCSIPPFWSQREVYVPYWGFLIPGLAALLLHGSEARAEESTFSSKAQQESAAPVSNDSTAKWRLYTDQAAKFGAQGELRRAERFLKLALDEAKQGFGLDDPHVAAATQNLAELYRVSRQYDLAGPLYEQALESLRSTFGELDVRTAAALHNAAGFYMETGEVEKAQQFYKRALEAKRATMGPAHPSVCDSLLPLARLLKRRGHPVEAVSMLQQQLKFLEDAGQGESKGALMLLGQQAAFHKEDGHPDKARPLLQRCYEIERERDPQSLTAAGAAEALASVLQDLERFDEARALLEESLSIQTAKRRNVIPADQTLKLVKLELRVGTPDSLLRAHNLAQRCCESIEALLSRYEAITSGSTGGWFSRKGPSQEQVQKTEKAVPGAVHTLVLAYIYLTYAQKGLHRVEEAESSLQKGLDATKSPLLQKALDAAQSSARLQTSVERQHAVEMEERILEDRQSCLETLLKDAATADEAYKKQRADKIHAWQEELAQLKKSREARMSQSAANS